MKRKIPLSSFLTLVLFFSTIWTLSVTPALADPEEEPLYVGVAKYYDNRKCVVTSTHDDLAFNTSAWQNCLSMLTEKKIYHTAAVITNETEKETEWDFIQYWVDQGYTEAGAHSRNHVHAPYTGNDPENGRPRISYEWQINGSKNDIIGNLTLPEWWRYGDREYVYAWIEPYGSCDDVVRQWLGDCHYLCDRLVGSGVYNLTGWDPSKGLFHRVGYTVEMGSCWGGETSVSVLNAKFDTAYSGGKIYHIITHPGRWNDWSEGSYSDQHTDYISNRSDVWYVPFGPLYLYHWVANRNIVTVTSTGSGQNKIFRLGINETDHQNYGISYPITYVFDIPSNWTDGYVYYRYGETDPWILMKNKSSKDFFNGITASRFNFTDNKAYVSISFSDVSHEIYLQLRNTKREGYLVVRGLNNRIYYRVYNSSGDSWEDWNVVPTGTTCDSPAAAICGGKLCIVVRGIDGYSLWYSWMNLTNGNFSDWTKIPGQTPSAPALASDGYSLYLAIRGMNDRVYYNVWNGSWNDWIQLLGSTSNSPAAAILNNTLHIVVTGAYGNRLWHGFVNLTDTSFSGWTRLSGRTPSAPTLASDGSSVYLVVRGTNNRIYYNVWNGGWNDWTRISSGSTTNSPAAAVLDGTLHIVVRGKNATSLWHSYVNLADNNFYGWIKISGRTPSAPTLTS